MATAIQGKDDYLFLANDSNGILDQHCGRVSIANNIDGIHACHRARAELMRELGGGYGHILVPNRETVARDLMPDEYRYEAEGLSPINQYMARKPDGPVYTFFDPQTLREFRSQGLFYRYGTHWTTRGAMIYADAAFRHFGHADFADALGRVDLVPAVDTAIGDLGDKIGRESERAETLAVVRHTVSSYFTNNITNAGCVRHFTKKDAPVARRVLLLHDSTAMWLVFILAEVFTELLMVHTPDMDPDFVRRFAPDQMFFMQMERFFVRAPDNAVSYRDFLADEEQQKGTDRSAIPHLSELGYL